MYKLIAFSDIHFHLYNNGLTIDDIVNLETEIIEVSKDTDFILFGGDRYLLRSPTTEVRLIAEESFKRLSDLGKPILILVGNHDRISRDSGSIHYAEFIKLYHQSLPNVHILDKVGSYKFDSIPDIRFDVCPSGQIKQFQYYQFSDTKYRVCLFHDLLKDSELASGARVENGIDPNIFDRKEYDLVLGGDNHTHQRLNFKNTLGYYIGAPCQHNWGDSKLKRGFLKVNLETKEVQHIKSQAPEFVKLSYTYTNESNIKELYRTIDTYYKNQLPGNIVNLEIQGELQNISKIDSKIVEDYILNKYGCRQVTINTSPTNTYRSIIPELETNEDPIEDWETYINSGVVNISDIDVNLVLETGRNIINEVTNEK